MNVEDMRAGRQNQTDSPFRTRSVEENLELFYSMRDGKMAEGECCLRLKINMQHNNPCMRDPVAYRIKYCPHPHAGSDWCIYPTYDMTHCVIDSLENITHSLCTLEFEIRRESYYWLLDALELYKPIQYEYSRLNVSGTVLSKRKINALITSGRIGGWDDPRLPTLMGFRRRGYTAEAINSFVDAVGVARKGNEKVVDSRVLDYHLRQNLEETAPRTFCVLDPIKLVIQGVPDDWREECEGELFPDRPERGLINYSITNEIYIERTDFSEEDGNKKFFGLSPSQIVRLRYSKFIKFEECVKNADGEIDHVKVSLLDAAPEGKKVKGNLHWVDAKDSLDIEVRLFDKIFDVDNPKEFGDDWLSHYNENSLVVKKAKWLKRYADAKPYDRFQFQRLGYFTVSDETTADNIVMFRTVTLSESKAKKEIDASIKTKK